MNRTKTTFYMRLFTAATIVVTVFYLMVQMSAPTMANPSDYYVIHVVDDVTGRGVPLVELRTVEKIRYYTDSNGVIAIDDADLMGQKIWFDVSSPGYSYPKDMLGGAGLALDVEPGQSTTIKITRQNIAERIYRLTGGGIYVYSVEAGLPVPISHPLIDGQVLGQDTVEVTPYNGKIYWFFGDTNKESYYLGHFGTSGATSDLPSNGGLNPNVGVNLNYYVDRDGFSRPTIKVPGGQGPTWIGGLFTMKDSGREHMFCHFDVVDHNMVSQIDGMAEWNDDTAMWTPIVTWDKNGLREGGDPFPVVNNGTHYLYCQADGGEPTLRNHPDLADMSNQSSYEAFTCLAPGTKFDHGNAGATQLDRGPDGHLIWGWKRNTSPLSDKDIESLVGAGTLRPDEEVNVLHDVDDNSTVLSGGGSVYWNAYRKRWVMITTEVFGKLSFDGESYFSEADTPEGPWLYAKHIATHGGWTFYNPAQHPFFDQDGGRVIYYEGTYVDSFSAMKDLTPRYNYDQIMYKLTLDDPRLSIPEPVYRITNADGSRTFAMKEELDANNEWNLVKSIPFYAIPATRNHDGDVPVYVTSSGVLQLTAPSASSQPLFYALASAAKTSPTEVPLYEALAGDGSATYSTDSTSSIAKSGTILANVWHNPSPSVVAVDPSAQPDPVLP